MRLDVHSNGQWKENAFRFNFPRAACSALRSNIPDFFHVMFKLGPVAEDPKAACKVPKVRTSSSSRCLEKEISIPGENLISPWL